MGGTRAVIHSVMFITICSSVVFWLDKRDFPENVHTVSVLK